MNLIEYTVLFSKKSHKDRTHAFLLVEYTQSRQLDELRNKIDPNDIYLKPSNYEPSDHVTLAELDDHINIKKLRKLLQPIEKYVITLDRLSIFELPKYDVLKCDVRSAEMYRSNRIILNNFQNRSRFKYYNPHMTVCNLKKGTASKYIGPIESFTMRPYRFNFSYHDKLGHVNNLYWN